jgi:glycosyltransferase involved in cell wall biosynthesis
MTDKNPSPLFSVIVPFYNEALYIKDTVASVLNQQCGNFELLCINDGSTDDSEKVIVNNSIDDKRIKIIRQHHLGKCVARNTGVKHAKGKWICFLNSGDIFYQNHLRVFKELINNYPDNSVFCTTGLNGINYNAFNKKKFFGNTVELNIRDFVSYDKFSLNQFCFKTALVNQHLFPSMNLELAEEILFLRQIVLSNKVIFKLTVSNASKLKPRFERNRLSATDKVNCLKLSADIFINNFKPEGKVKRTIEMATRFKSLNILYYYKEYWRVIKLLLLG